MANLDWTHNSCSLFLFSLLTAVISDSYENKCKISCDFIIYKSFVLGKRLAFGLFSMFRSESKPGFEVELFNIIISVHYKLQGK